MSCDQFLDALVVTNPDDDFAAIAEEKGKVLARSCEWILERPGYIKWSKTNTVQLLKVSGQPGVGKTTIVWSIFKRLALQTRKDLGGLTICYFFDARYQDRRSIHGAIRSLILQILRERGDLFEFVLGDALRLQENCFSDDFQTLWRILLVLIRNLTAGHIYVLIDAIDECEDDHKLDFLEALKTLHASLHNCNFSILITGNLNSEEYHDLDETWNTIRIDSRSISNDLSAFLDVETTKLSEQSFSSDCLLNMKMTLKHKTDSTFLSMSLILKDLAKTKKDEAVQKLRSLPCSLDEIFARVLQRVEPENTLSVVFALHFLAFAQRPLTTVELATALALIHKVRKLDDLQAYGELREIDNIESSIDPLIYVDPAQKTIKFVHQSVKDFLISDKLGEFQGLSPYRLSAIQAHRWFFQTCWLCFLNEGPNTEFDIFQRRGRWLKRQKRIQIWGENKNEPLYLSYARKYWALHFIQCNGTVDLLSQLNREELSKLPTIRDALLLACIKSRKVLMAKHLLREGAQPDITDRRGRAPLQLAIKNHDYEMVTMLIGMGAKIYLSDGNGVPPLEMPEVQSDNQLRALLREQAIIMVPKDTEIAPDIRKDASYRLKKWVFLMPTHELDVEKIKYHFAHRGRMNWSLAVQILQEATTIMEHEANLLELDSVSINICGCVHGKYADLLELLEIDGPPPCNQFLFLGGYINLSGFGIECLLYLCALKLRYPTKIWLLRGKSEDESIVRVSGFYDQLRSEFNDNFKRVYQAALSCFENMPLAAIVNQKLLCVHGGLCPEWQNIHDVNRIKKPQKFPNEGFLTNLLFAEPGNFYDSPLSTDLDYVPADNGVGWTYSYRAVCAFLSRNDLLGLVTSGNHQERGYLLHRKTEQGFPSVVAISSAPGLTDGFRGKGAVVNCSRNRRDGDTRDGDVITIKIFEATPLYFWMQEGTLNVANNKLKRV